MKKVFLPFLFCGLPFLGHAQVDNYCLRLANDGAVNCGSMPELDQAQQYTLQFWMCADEWTPGAQLLSRGDQLQVILGSPSQLKFQLGNETLTLENSLLAPQKWAQITLLVDGQKARVLVNGKQLKEQSGDFAQPTTGEIFTLGGHQYKGRIDEVRVWNTLLSDEFDYFVHNTLNKWVPQLDHLVAYYKFDQEQCPNIVDYKALFQPAEYNHHGVLTANDAQREIVKDNSGLPYLLSGGYTNINRFFDRGIDREKFLLTNDLIILGIQSYADGHLKYASTNDHATMGEGVSHLAEFAGRKGVLAFTGKEGMTTTADVLTPAVDANGKVTKGYTFETWLYLDQWTPGAFLFKKMTADGKGFSISLGEEATHQVIVNVDGNTYVNQSPLITGKWMHVAVSVNAGGTPASTFLFAYDGKAAWADAQLSSGSTDYSPSSMQTAVAKIGEGLVGKMDATLVWNDKYDITSIQGHMVEVPFPDLGKTMNAQTFLNSSACYLYDDAAQPGWDAYSMDEWKNRMVAAYKGYRGYQVRISVMGHKNWQNTIADAAKRKIFAQDLARLSEGYDGVELDLEWMDGVQTSLGLLAKEIRAALPKGKTFKISCHAYGAYKFPVKDMTYVDGFTFQQYGPQKNWFTLDSFVNSYKNFVNYGFAKDKIYLSYATTTSGPYNAADKKQNGGISGWRKVVSTAPYEPSSNMGWRKAKIGDFFYYYQSPEQVYRRGKFVVENHLQGIFYWDMGNDINTAAPYSIARYNSYALNSNVDSLVTEVKVHVPTGIGAVTHQPRVQMAYDAADGTLSIQGSAAIIAVEVHALSGQRVAYGTGNRVNLHQLQSGTYVVTPFTAEGRMRGLLWLKK